MGQKRILPGLFLVPFCLFCQDDWAILWSDEFNGPANTVPDARNWTFDLGGGGWGHGELETYTNSLQNISLDGDGNLVIRALAGSGGQYTSARIKTQGLFTIAYGKIEARIKLPAGQGVWPALWMLGATFPTAGWPRCGEIDVMENIGKEKSTVHGSLHGPGYSGAGAITAAYTLPAGRAFSDDFHVFAVVWRPGAIEFFVDGTSYQKIDSTMPPPGAAWPFDSPFFLILDLAVGGDWPGAPDSTTVFPQQMTIDYVRVYRSTTSPVVNPGGVLSAASYSPALAPGSLATLFGTGLADRTYAGLFDVKANAFPKTAAGVSVFVAGAPAPLIYVSPVQINFQVPWSTVPGGAAVVTVNRGTLASNQLLIQITDAAPDLFQSGQGQAILACTGGSRALGAECTLWGTGFGVKTMAQSDGAPATAPPYPYAMNACTLTIGEVGAAVTYCGAAPGQIIDQLNFIYPAAIPSASGGVVATLKIGSATGTFHVPVPDQ